MNYHNKQFKVMHNTANGEVAEAMVFAYRQKGSILTSEYQGGGIVKGQLIGLVDEAGNINMRYQQVNNAGELMTGICQSKPEVLPNGKIRLHETWQWTSGDGSNGTSILEEV